MWLARKATVTTISSKPCRCSRSTMCSIIGRLASGIIGLGALEVSGRSRVPSPPAMITAFIAVRTYPVRALGRAAARPSRSAAQADRDVQQRRRSS